MDFKDNYKMVLGREVDDDVFINVHDNIYKIIYDEQIYLISEYRYLIEDHIDDLIYLPIYNQIEIYYANR
jgi:hypothetical protein